MQQETPFTDMDWARMELEGAANVFRRSLTHSLPPSSLSLSHSLVSVVVFYQNGETVADNAVDAGE